MPRGTIDFVQPNIQNRLYTCLYRAILGLLDKALAVLVDTVIIKEVWCVLVPLFHSL